MKIVVNACYGGFGLSEKARAVVRTDDIRTDENLIRFIEENGSEAASKDYAYLKVVEIPDDATDYDINEYDGFESIVYVLNGKLHYIWEEQEGHRPFVD